MACKERATFWSSFVLFIASVVLISLYFSCVNICIVQWSAFKAPIWTSVLCIVLAIFGFVTSTKKHRAVLDGIYATICVLSMICTLVCIYLLIDALIHESKNKTITPSSNYMTAMVLLIAMCGTAGTMLLLTIVSTSALQCCPYCNETGANAVGDNDLVVMQNTDYLRDPPYAPTTMISTADEPDSMLSPTAPPLFLSPTLRREQGMEVTPSADRRSFSANVVEIAELLREVNDDMPTFSASNAGSQSSLSGVLAPIGPGEGDKVPGDGKNNSSNAVVPSAPLFKGIEDATNGSSDDEEPAHDYTEIRPASGTQYRVPVATPLPESAGRATTEDDYAVTTEQRKRGPSIAVGEDGNATIYVNSTVHSPTLPILSSPPPNEEAPLNMLKDDSIEYY